jgi:enoyl-CoA hydratase/carnithine racemase
MGVLTLRIVSVTKPMVSAVNGWLLGVGVTIHLPMDVWPAAESARFAFLFSRRGIVPEARSIWASQGWWYQPSG